MVVSVLLWLMAIIGVLLISIVCLPIRFHGWVDTTAATKIRLTVAPLGGLVPLPIIGESKPTEGEGRKRKPERARKRPPIKLPLLQAGYQTFVSMLRRFRLEEATADIQFGCPDPADTGAFFGSLVPIVRRIDALPKIRMSVRPDFQQSSFAALGQISFRVTPIQLAPPLLVFVWSAFIQPKFARSG